MNPTAIRSAIVTALSGRAAWDGIDMFRYPPGDRAEWKTGFVLGEITNVDRVDIDMAGTHHEVTYEMAGGLWVGKTGATDADYADVEGDAIDLISDFEAWIAVSDHGKSINVATLDYLELARWELAFTPSPTAAVIDFTLDVIERT